MAAAVKTLCTFGGLTLGAFCSLKVCKALSENAGDAPDNNRAIDSGNLELVAVQVAFRHGARTPIVSIRGFMDATWDKDVHMGDLPHTAIEYDVMNILGGPKPFSEYDRLQMRKTLKGGSHYGQLTKVGQQQMYDIGKQLGKYYIDEMKLINAELNPDEVYIRTTNIKRTIDSARCIIAGMFGIEGIKGPVTMYTLPQKQEYLYPNTSSCEYITEWVHSAFRNCDGLDGFREKRLHVEKLLGLQDKQANFLQIYDVLAAHKGHNLPIPDAVSEIWNMIQHCAIQIFASTNCGCPQDSQKMLRLGIGTFLEEIFQQMKSHVEGRSSYKLFLFSGHDTSILVLLVALGIFDQKWPPFGARVEFELYRSREEEYFVRVLYKGKEQILPGCDEALCPLDRFREVISPYFVENMENECRINKQEIAVAR